MHVNPHKLPPTLIAIGGFPGSGKSTVARMISEEFGIPRFGSDFFGRTIKASKELLKDETKAFWIGYELMFKCAQEQLSRGVSVIIGTSFGLEFQWQKLDSIIEETPGIISVPIVIRTERSACEARIQSRHLANPDYYDPPKTFHHERFDIMWSYFESLDRTDIHFIDGAPEIAEVYKSAFDIVTEKSALPDSTTETTREG